MGKYKQGILGPFSGKIGNVIGATNNGVHYMRIVPANVQDPKTDKQLAQRQRFGMMTKTLKLFRPAIEIGFRVRTGNTRPVNRALSYNIKNAITGDYPDQEIDFEAFAIARGDLTDGTEITAESTTPGELTLTWTDNSGESSAKADDNLAVACYHPENQQLYFKADTAARQDGTVSLVIPAMYHGFPVHTYAFFASSQSEDVTNSVYTGEITIQS